MTESWEFGDDPEMTPQGFPWPPPEDGPILPAFAAAWKGATFDPGRFFAGTPRDRGTGPALLYYLSIGILVAGATLFWDSLPFYAGSAMSESWADLGYGTVSPLVRFLLAPAFLLAGLFLSSGVVHVLLLIFSGAEHGYGTTLRVFCYANSPTLFGIVPIVGTLVGAVWSLAISIIGLREAHETDGWKAALAVLIPVVGSMLLFAILAFAAIIATGTLLPTG
ncbi:MAG: YIP1 family protein [Longimicrobiales bacterium]|nr:YIP1 family protein [Longimicrobiales bacterium]